MNSKFLYKVKTQDKEMESDHIVLVDSDGKKLECFWFTHDVVLRAEGFKNFKFLKSQDAKAFQILSILADTIEQKDKFGGDNFVNGNKFIWHSISRDWLTPIEKNAGFNATLNEDSVDIEFFPSERMVVFGLNPNKFLISMGGIDGYNEPYQSISDIFSIFLNKMLEYVEYKPETDNNNSM